MPPGVILRQDHPGTWTYTDRVLAVGWVWAQRSRCPGCGQPKAEAWNPDSDGWYEGHEADCNGCAAIQRLADGEKHPRPDRKRWAVDTRPTSVELKPWAPGRLTAQPSSQQPGGSVAG